MPVPEMPLSIADEEKIVRCIFFPSHFDNNGQIKPAAFHPKGETEEISAIRHDYVGTTFCKTKAKGMEGPKREYRGLGVLTAAQIRSTSCEVIDSREEFWGHADIKMGFVVPSGNPRSSKETDKLLERKKALVKALQYFPDPSPETNEWAGDKIEQGVKVDLIGS
jgi:hypothetical protein